jgi:hypothetical protein
MAIRPFETELERLSGREVKAQEAFRWELSMMSLHSRHRQGFSGRSPLWLRPASATDTTFTVILTLNLPSRSQKSTDAPNKINNKLRSSSELFSSFTNIYNKGAAIVEGHVNGVQSRGPLRLFHPY